jgi:sarcosine oxidase
MKTAVIGLGAAGSAALRFLAEGGHTAVGYEQFEPGHSNGSSHGESRIIRFTYPDAFYTELMTHAYPLWNRLEEQAGEELFVRCGILFFDDPDHPDLNQIMDALLAHRMPYEALTPEAVQERFPAIHLQPGETALFQRDAGFLRATRCVLANLGLAQQHGAEVRKKTRVASVEQRGSQVLLRTSDGGEMVYDRVVLTAGAWLGKLLPELNLPLTVTRQTIAYFAIARNEDYFQPERMPVWIDAGTYFYGFPADGRVPGVKLALHQWGEILDPDQPRKPFDNTDAQPLLDYIYHRLPDLSEHVTHSLTCLYTNTPDEDFILDRVPSMPGVWLLSGCSGHGFKFSVLMGKLAAGLATGQEVEINLQRFALRR